MGECATSDSELRKSYRRVFLTVGPRLRYFCRRNLAFVLAQFHQGIRLADVIRGLTALRTKTIPELPDSSGRQGVSSVDE